MVKIKVSRLNKLVEKAGAAYSEKDVHRLRLGVKKTKALLGLLAARNAATGKVTLPKRLKKLYEAAGKLRDTQLLLLQLHFLFNKTNPIPAGYLRAIRKEQKKHTKALQQLLEKEPRHHNYHTLFAALPHSIQEAHIAAFFHQRLKAIHQLLAAKNMSDEQLHTARKNAKDIVYGIELLKPSARKKIMPGLLPDTALVQIKTFSKQAGLINDLSTCLSFIQPARLDNTTATEKKLLLAIKKQWLTEKHDAKKKLLASYQKVFAQLCLNAR